MVSATTPINPFMPNGATLRGLRGAPEVPPLCRETQPLGPQMLNAPFGINGLIILTVELIGYGPLNILSVLTL